MRTESGLHTVTSRRDTSDDARATVDIIRTNPKFVVHARHVDVMQPILLVERGDPSDKLPLAPLFNPGGIFELDFLDNVDQHAALALQQSLSVGVNFPTPGVIKGLPDHSI